MSSRITKNILICDNGQRVRINKITLVDPVYARVRDDRAMIFTSIQIEGGREVKAFDTELTRSTKESLENFLGRVIHEVKRQENLLTDLGFDQTNTD